MEKKCSIKTLELISDLQCLYLLVIEKVKYTHTEFPPCNVYGYSINIFLMVHLYMYKYTEGNKRGEWGGIFIFCGCFYVSETFRSIWGEPTVCTCACSAGLTHLVSAWSQRLKVFVSSKSLYTPILTMGLGCLDYNTDEVIDCNQLKTLVTFGTTYLKMSVCTLIC